MHCEPCQRFFHPSVRFKVTIATKDNLVYDEEISLAIMLLDGKAVIHIVSTATRFSAVKFIDIHSMNYGRYVNGIWIAFVMTWSLVYKGYPNSQRIDKGSVLVLGEWKLLADTNEIQFWHSGIEAHRSSEIGEKYQNSLRQNYRQIRFTHPSVPPPYLLKVASEQWVIIWAIAHLTHLNLSLVLLLDFRL